MVERCDKLKACPCCGGHGEMRGNDDRKSAFRYVVCDDCGLTTKIFSITFERNICPHCKEIRLNDLAKHTANAWNKRIDGISV